MTTVLLWSTPLNIAALAARTCYDSYKHSDSSYPVAGQAPVNIKDLVKAPLYDDFEEIAIQTLRPDLFPDGLCGPKDIHLLDTLVHQYHHESVIEHITFTFFIRDISRAVLQELARHRIASYSVKSTRHTLKELKKVSDDELGNFIVSSGDELIDKENINRLKNVRSALQVNIPMDKVKYLLPEAYKTSLIWTINARSLRNFLKLRLNRKALAEISTLANKIKECIPDTHKILFEGIENEL